LPNPAYSAGPVADVTNGAKETLNRLLTKNQSQGTQ